jgi:hypothetical protein
MVRSPGRSMDRPRTPSTATRKWKSSATAPGRAGWGDDAAAGRDNFRPYVSSMCNASPEPGDRGRRSGDRRECGCRKPSFRGLGYGRLTGPDGRRARITQSKITRERSYRDLPANDFVTACVSSLDSNNPLQNGRFAEILLLHNSPKRLSSHRDQLIRGRGKNFELLAR